MKSWQLTRREALRCLAALGAIPVVGCIGETDPASLVALRRDRRSAELLGRAWLAGQRPEPSAQELVARICGESGCAGFADDGERMRRLIRARHRSDFEQGRLVSVDGWLMSQTEVALYALVAIGA